MAKQKALFRSGTKTAFIAAHLDKSIDEIIAAGRAEKIQLTRQLIHTARHNLKARGITTPVADPNATAGSAPRARSKRAESSPKIPQLQRLILEVGIDAARGVFDEIHARIGA